MSFFKRNKNGPLIPPVSAPEIEPKPDPYANAPSSNRYGAAANNDPYASAKAKPAPSGDPYARAGTGAGAEKAGGDDNPYAKKSTAIDSARDELFAGFKAPDKPAADRKYGYEGREEEEDYDEDEEVEGIKQEMRGLKQDSLASSR